VTGLSVVIEKNGFSGVVALTGTGWTDSEIVAGLADRAQRRPNQRNTAFAIASMTKGFVAVAVMSLVESGALALDTRLRDLVGDELPLVDPAVTIETLLAHRSGVGDYLDEEQLVDIDDFIFDVSAHTLATPDDYLPHISGHPQVSAPGERFAYNNGGFVMLSIAMERATGARFHDLVRERVFEPAKMTGAGFFRSDDLPANAALGYVKSGRTNVFHLPVIGGGDGGAYVTAEDMSAFWIALFDGRLLSNDLTAAMIEPVSEAPGQKMRYGLGFWLAPEGDAVVLEGMDAGVSACSSFNPTTGRGYTVLSNTSTGTRPVVRHLEDESLSFRC
jgi:CubicO group peptidase (beta-lactamase class C family)